MIEVITGPMFAGKSTLLDKLITASDTDDRPWVALRPAADTREPRFAWERSAVVIHNVAHLAEEISKAQGRIFIDEAQFFWPAISTIVATASRARSVSITIAGLNLDWRGRPWPAMAGLLCYADRVTVLSATCWICGGVATMTRRTGRLPSWLVVPGGSELYQPACVRCWRSANKET